MLYLGNWEDQVKAKQRDEDFKSQVFVADLWPAPYESLQNFKALFPEDAKPKNAVLTLEEEEQLDWIVPDSPEEAEEMVQMLREMGLS